MNLRFSGGKSGVAMAAPVPTPMFCMLGPAGSFPLGAPLWFTLAASDAQCCLTTTNMFYIALSHTRTNMHCLFQLHTHMPLTFSFD